MIVEVLSESSEAFDRGRKFGHYRQIPTLREYVLVSQAEARIECFWRNDDDTWTMSEAAGLDSVLRLRSLGIEISLRELYDKVDFGEAASLDVDTGRA